MITIGVTYIEAVKLLIICPVRCVNNPAPNDFIAYSNLLMRWLHASVVDLGYVKSTTKSKNTDHIVNLPNTYIILKYPSFNLLMPKNLVWPSFNLKSIVMSWIQLFSFVFFYLKCVLSLTFESLWLLPTNVKITQCWFYSKAYA